MDYIISIMPSMFDGLATTLKIFFITLGLSLPIGILIALGRTSKVKIINSIIQFYVWVMRGTPLLLQLIFIFFGLPKVGIVFTRETAVYIAFALNYGAYFGEIFRGGLLNIDRGQYEAADVLGYSSFQTYKRIILPQVFKNVLPPISNEVITLVKDTALVYVVGLGELLRAGKIAVNRDASLVPLLVVGVFYLILTAILTKLFKILETRFAYYE